MEERDRVEELLELIYGDHRAPLDWQKKYVMAYRRRMDAEEKSIILLAEVLKLRTALETLHRCADSPWERRLIEKALEPEGED